MLRNPSFLVWSWKFAFVTGCSYIYGTWTVEYVKFMQYYKVFVSVCCRILAVNITTELNRIQHVIFATGFRESGTKKRWNLIGWLVLVLRTEVFVKVVLKSSHMAVVILCYVIVRCICDVLSTWSYCNVSFVFFSLQNSAGPSFASHHITCRPTTCQNLVIHGLLAPYGLATPPVFA